MPRYAENTKVTVDTSRGDISGILAKHGVVRMAWGTDLDGDTLQFELEGRQFRFYIQKPTMAEVRAMYPNAYDHQAKLDGEWRRRWRAHVLLLKAKLEFADGEGGSTIMRELMPYMLLRDGRTMEDAIAAGAMPLALASGKG